VVSLLISAFCVFAITLVITKAEILACPRSYVEKRYELSKISGRPGYIHWIWKSMWLCPMCLGFWVSLGINIVWPVAVAGVLRGTLFCFAVNWLLHCAEDSMFQGGKMLEQRMLTTKILDETQEASEDGSQGNQAN